jgi:hypothetical protein
MENPQDNSQAVLKDFIKTFIGPVLLNKIAMMYFGLNYSNHPGEGYGYGLLMSIGFLLFTMGMLVWKYKDIEDP